MRRHRLEPVFDLCRSTAHIFSFRHTFFSASQPCKSNWLPPEVWSVRRKTSFTQVCYHQHNDACVAFIPVILLSFSQMNVKLITTNNSKSCQGQIFLNKLPHPPVWLSWPHRPAPGSNSTTLIQEQFVAVIIPLPTSSTASPKAHYSASCSLFSLIRHPSIFQFAFLFQFSFSSLNK